MWRLVILQGSVLIFVCVVHSRKTGVVGHTKRQCLALQTAVSSTQDRFADTPTRTYLAGCDLTMKVTLLWNTTVACVAVAYTQSGYHTPGTVGPWNVKDVLNI